MDSSLRYSLGKTNETLVELNKLKEQIGRLREQTIHSDSLIDENVEFSVYSQGGEDGIIQAILKVVYGKSSKSRQNKSFVEFGVEDYREANTRYLALAHGWRGVVMDGSPSNINALTNDFDYWRMDVRGYAEFITAENVETLIYRYSPDAENLKLLSIDIDGNDYWVWKALTIRPEIVIVEYNHRFGATKSVVVPYDPAFNRYQAHYSGIYFGCSLQALVKLGKEKGYRLVATNSTGVNAFFVRNDVLGDKFKVRTELLWNAGTHREGRDALGEMAWYTPEDEQEILAGLPIEIV